MAVEVFIHKMTEHMETGEIVGWTVKEGDRIEQYQVIMEVTTDKAVADLEAPAAGILKGIRPGATAGAIVPVGETLAFIAQPDEEVPQLPPLGAVTSETTTTAESRPRAVEPERGGSLTTSETPAASTTTPRKVHASPAVRRLARELSVNLTLVRGAGPNARITADDVRAFSEAGPARPTSQPAPTDVQWLDLNAIQRLTGERMLKSAQTIPQFTLSSSVDMTDAIWLREAFLEPIAAKTGQRLSITTMLVKTVATALKKHARANASFEDGRVKLFGQVNIGVAVGTEQGLVVPVIREADRKSLPQLARELKSLQDKAETMRFRNEDLSGGTFTISNLGMYGVDHFRALVNPPESAILAVGRIVKTPVGMPDDTIALRSMMNLCLSADHRTMDGVQAAQFLADVKQGLEKPHYLLELM